MTIRGITTRPLFADDEDRWRFLGILSDVTHRFDWRCLMFCLMTTHYHLLVEEGEVPLARVMQRLNSAFATAMNERHVRVGHVFAGRYGDTHVRTDEHLLAAVVYIARNPCEPGLCADPEAWPWSSYGALVGAARPWSFISSARLLALLSLSRDQLREVVAQGSDPGVDTSATSA